MKMIVEGIKLGTVVFTAFLTFKFLGDAWKWFWGFLASMLENAEKKKKASTWEDSVGAEVDDGK